MHGGRGEGGAGVPLDVGGQLEDGRAAVGRLLPRVGQLRARLEVAVVGDEAVEHAGRDRQHRRREVRPPTSPADGSGETLAISVPPRTGSAA